MTVLVKLLLNEEEQLPFNYSDLFDTSRFFIPAELLIPTDYFDVPDDANAIPLTMEFFF